MTKVEQAKKLAEALINTSFEHTNVPLVQFGAALAVVLAHLIAMKKRGYLGRDLSLEVYMALTQDLIQECGVLMSLTDEQVVQLKADIEAADAINSYKTPSGQVN